MRKRLTTETLPLGPGAKTADPYTMNQERHNPNVTKYMNWERTPGHDLPFGGPADTHGLHERDKDARDPATHLLVPDGGLKKSSEINRYLRTKASRAIRLAKLFFQGQEVKASVLEKVATKLMNLNDDALVATLGLVGADAEEGPQKHHKKPVIIDDWQEGEGKKVGKEADTKDAAKKTDKKADTKTKAGGPPVIEDHTNAEGEKLRHEDNFGATEEFPVKDGTHPDKKAATKKEADESEEEESEEEESEEESDKDASTEQKMSHEASIDAMLADLDPMTAAFGEQEVEFHEASVGITDEVLAALFTGEGGPAPTTAKTANAGQGRVKTASKEGQKKGVKKIASAPASANMSNADLGMSLFGTGVPQDPTGGLF